MPAPLRIIRRVDKKVGRISGAFNNLTRQANSCRRRRVGVEKTAAARDDSDPHVLVNEPQLNGVFSIGSNGAS
jgi:hypothetical protein